MTLSDFKIENNLEFIENKLFPIDGTDYGNFINIDETSPTPWDTQSTRSGKKPLTSATAHGSLQAWVD